MSLTSVEARYLSERVRISCRGSVLATLLGQPGPVGDEVTAIRQYPHLLAFPAEQRVWIEHGRNLSDTIHGAVLLYDLLPPGRPATGIPTSSDRGW